MDKRFWAVIAAIALVFVGIIVVNKKSADAPGASNTSNNSAVKATNHVKGENSKNVTLVEYGDFQCPVCALYEPTVQQIYEKYKGDIKFQFRHFPLQQIHQNAFAASRAAEAAGMQGKFWEMHDQLYANQNAWAAAANPLDSYEQYAKTIGIPDTAKFKADFSSSRVNSTINADIKEGTKLKITGTPSFFLDGKAIELETLVGENNQPSVEKFSKYIDDAIAKKNKSGQ